jgi:hypothetical protein
MVFRAGLYLFMLCFAVLPCTSGLLPVHAQSEDSADLLLNSTGADAYQRNSVPPSAQTIGEEYVLRQIASGQEADLKGRFPDDTENRVIRGDFVRQILTIVSSRYRVVPHGIQIRNAVVKEDVDLENQEVLYDVKLLDCVFEDFFDATGCHFHRSLSVDGSHFDGSVDFSSVTISNDLTAVNSEFRNTKKSSDPNDDAGAYFAAIRVGGDVFLRGAKFEQKVDFTSAQIERRLVADGATFSSRADFGDIKVKGDGFFRKATFEGQACFNDAHFTNLFLSDAKFNDQAENEPTIFKGLKVDTAALDGIYIPGKIQIEDMNYQSVSPAVWMKLKPIISNWQTSSEFYENLEALFRRRGFTEQADEIYVERRERERGQMGLARRVGDCVEDVVLGYGRHLDRLLYVSAVFVVIGWFVFFPNGMARKKPGDPDPCGAKYSAFWYSLDLFVPIIGLDQADIWVPRETRPFARNYARLHKIIGNLIVPIGLAALTGIIK